MSKVARIHSGAEWPRTNAPPGRQCLPYLQGHHYPTSTASPCHYLTSWLHSAFGYYLHSFSIRSKALILHSGHTYRVLRIAECLDVSRMTMLNFNAALPKACTARIPSVVGQGLPHPGIEPGGLHCGPRLRCMTHAVLQAREDYEALGPTPCRCTVRFWPLAPRGLACPVSA